jgi:hypothetical protein
MRKLLILTLCLLFGCGVAYAGTIKSTGMSQKDLVSLLTKMVTMVNELKADHNGLVADMTAASGIKTQFSTYSTSMKSRTTSSTDLSLTQ